MKKLNIITTICMLVLTATSCSSDSKETTPTPPPGNTVTYSKDIQPLSFQVLVYRVTVWEEHLKEYLLIPMKD